MDKTKDLVKEFALTDDLMFINALVTRIAKEKEVTFITFSGAVHTGFITGLDNDWIQLTTTEVLAFDMVQIVNVESWCETGQNLRIMEKIAEANNDQNSLQKIEKIREYAEIIYKKARAIYTTRPSRRRGNFYNGHTDNGVYMDETAAVS